MPDQVNTRPNTQTEPELIALRYSLTMSEDTETAEILVYGYIVSSTAFYRWLKLDTDDLSASDFDKLLKDAKSKGARNLHLRINSGGGIVPQAQAMRTMLLGAGFDKIVITVDGICASAATLLVCIPNAHVRVSEGSEFMIHRPRYGAWGTIDDLKSAVQRMEAMHETVCGIYSNHTKQDEKQIMEWMTAETWFNAKKAVKAGFAHEVYKGDTQAVACVSPDMMLAMKSQYKHVPDDVLEAQAEPEEPTAHAEEPQNSISTEIPAINAGVSPENKNNSEEDTKPMANENTPGAATGIGNMTAEQLRAANPELFASVMQSGSAEERTRMEEIDAVTPPGYEEMAKKAKADGTSAQDYFKQVVAAQKKRGTDFVQQRQAETAAGSAVPGAAADNANGDPENNSDRDAKDIAKYALMETGGHDGGMY